jgi:hypothetical protein
MARPPLLFLMIMPVHPMRWTHEQFDEMSWHDNHVHSLRVLEGENGAGELLLDLDYILEWLKCTDTMRFDLVPATLRFTGVTNLRIFLDYASPSAAMGPFSIHAIERSMQPRERYVAQVWKLVVNWPVGEISFEASGYEQCATGKPIVSDVQHLSAEERKGS